MSPYTQSSNEVKRSKKCKIRCIFSVSKFDKDNPHRRQTWYPRGAIYPYSSIRQDHRNRKRYGVAP